MKETNYSLLNSSMEALIGDLKHEISILSNASALINMHMAEINWVGFYLLNNNELILGPFQGKPACTNIPLNKGVCGACATSEKTIIVDNVHEFKGHIACDSASNSEICVPIFKNNKFYGLLDIDSPIYNRFNDNDKQGLEKTINIIEKTINSLN